MPRELGIIHADKMRRASFSQFSILEWAGGKEESILMRPRDIKVSSGGGNSRGRGVYRFRA